MPSGRKIIIATMIKPNMKNRQSSPIRKISGTIVKILSIVLLMAVGIVLILGIGTLFKGGETSKKYSNKLMQLRVLLQFIAVIALIGFAYFFKN